MIAVKFKLKNRVLTTLLVLVIIGITANISLTKKAVDLHRTIAITEEPITKDQTTPLIGRWKRLMEANGNKAYLFFKHNRRTGGTSMREYLENVLCHHADDCAKPANYHKKGNKEKNSKWSGLHYYELEFRSMHWNCHQLDAERWNRTLSVTIFRPPIERHLSEFFLTGNPSNELKQMKVEKNFSKEFFALLEAEVIPWIQRGTHMRRIMGRSFRDEYYVRAFAGETSDLPKNTTDEPPCFYGGGSGGGGADPNIEVNDIALMRAKQTLRQFDLVLLTESMNSNPEIVSLMSDVLDYPINASAIPHKNSVGIAENKNIMLSGIETHAPKLYEAFQNNTAFEKQLYDYAKQINQDLLQQWRYEKSAAGTKRSA